jgi:nucleotide-binding universal stress UspA family protein
MPLTIQSVVCAVDFSSFSPLVVRYGVALARRAEVRLYLLHAVPDPQDRVHRTTEFERGGDLTHHTDDARQRIGKLMSHAPVDWEAVVCFGDPVEQTVAFAERLPQSLVVCASHGVSGFRRLFIGTVVERMTRALARPVLVVKPGEGKDDNRCDTFRRAVVSCDGHGYWQRLAPLLPLFQPDSDSQIRLVHTLERPMGKTVTDVDAASYGQVQLELQSRLNQELYQQAQRLFHHTHRISVDIAPGVPQEMVLHVVREHAADVIAVGVRRSGKVGRWISGSTTEALLRRSPCSVLTVPEPQERHTPGGESP